MAGFISKLLLTWVLIIGLYSHAHSQDSINIGFSDYIHSSILDEDRRLLIHLPAGISDTSRPRPVVYLLDADINFQYFVGISSFLSYGTRNELPEPIVVGIINTHRTRDLTPTRTSVVNPKKNEDKLFAESGGGAAFFRFIQNELKPYIRQRYQEGGRQILIGHSFGGLAVIDCLLHHPEYFDAYVANDPSLWWDELYEIKQAEQQWKEAGNSWEDKKLFISHSGAAVGGGHFAANGSSANAAFSEELKKMTKGLVWREKTYSGETHGTVSLVSNIDAWRFLWAKE